MMNEIDLFVDLPITAQAAVICFVVCAVCLLVMLLAAPRRDYFFFRWHPEIRLLAMLVSPVLLIVWPVVLYALILKSRGIDWKDLDFFDD
jgi:hypothetical protein